MAYFAKSRIERYMDKLSIGLQMCPVVFARLERMSGKILAELTFVQQKVHQINYPGILAVGVVVKRQKMGVFGF